MNKNDIYEIVIEDYTTDGEGVGKIDAFPLFVKDTAVGDRILCKVIKLKKTYGYARLEKVLEPSPDRIEPVCGIARACGGCQLMQMSYEAELRYKTKKVRENLRRIGNVEIEVPDCLGMKDIFNYRNKAQIPVGYTKDGSLKAGFYAGRTHDIVEMESCAITFPETQEILRIVLEWMKRFKISAYDEETGKGLIRHVLIRKGFKSGEIIVCLIANTRKLPHCDELAECLKAVDGFAALSLNINEQRGNTILGRETIALYGAGYIEDEIGSVRFRISPNSFYQVNPVQTEVLYGKALEFAGLTGTENVFDVYCGIGTISLFMARHAKKVYGVEIVPQAIEDAKKNAAINRIDNAEFYVGAAEEILPVWFKTHPDEKIDVVCVDPPRKGCDPVALQTIAAMNPDRIVYVSCDSATLARDLKIMREEYGYAVEKVQPVDMFPRTVCCEAVAVLKR